MKGLKKLTAIILCLVMALTAVPMAAFAQEPEATPEPYIKIVFKNYEDKDILPGESVELYLDYGDRIKGASKAEQTFLVQLACGNGGTYLPSERSGTTGYGSVPASSIVTFDGGEIIVRESIKDINALFEQ